MRKTLSVVLAVYNEENNLAACLDSIKDIADEIVAVDGSSKDKTVDIAKKFGAKVKVTTNKPIFHINKQMAIDMATSDWILQLDADERVTPELAKEIKSIVNNQSSIINDVNGYWIPRKNWFLGRFLMKGGQYPDYTLRLYRRGRGRLPQKDVHEQAEVEGKVSYLKNPLLHYPYKNFQDYIFKWNRYTDLIALQTKEKIENKDIASRIFFGIGLLFIKPLYWFFITYIRHKGFMDLWPGFVFSLFSSLRFPVSYIKYLGTYKFTIIIVFLIAFALRFYDFQNRWGLAYNQARDTIVAHYAIMTHQIPLIGPFSASGPFVFGPYMYWFYMLLTSVNSESIIFLWIVQAFISALMPLVMYLIGKEVANREIGLVAAFFTAISTAQIAQSTNLTYSTFVGFVSMLVLLFAVRTIKVSRDRYPFLLALTISLSVNIHFQAVGLILILFIIPFFTKITIKRALLIASGFFIPFLPLIFFDFISNHFQSRHLFEYFLSRGENTGGLQKRWLTYVSVYWPTSFSHIIGGYPFIAYIVGASVIWAIINSFWKKNLNKVILFVLFFFLVNFVILRYFKGAIFDSFLAYLHPTIFVLTAWAIFKLKKLNIYFAVILFLVITFLTLARDFHEIKNATNTTAVYSSKYLRMLTYNYPGHKFSFYDYQFKSRQSSFPIVMYFMKSGLVSDSGSIKIGFGTAENSAELKKYKVQVLHDEKSELYSLFNLTKYNDTKLKEAGWVFINPSEVYKSTEKWYLDESKINY